MIALPPRLRIRLRLWLLARLAVVALFGAGSLGATCGGPRRVAHVAITTAGTALAQLHAEHQRVYREATDAVRVDLERTGGSREEYLRRTAPADREFDSRGAALQDLDAGIYSAAALNDAVREGAPMSAVQAAARHVLGLISRALDRLEAGGVLPPVPIPAPVRAIVSTLTAYAGAPSNGR